jgi:hypothetical protein
MEADGVLPWIAVEHRGAAGIGPQQTQQDADRRCLARTVGTEEAMDLAGRDRQIQTVECASAPKTLHQAGHRDRRCRHMSERTLTFFRNL